MITVRTLATALSIASAVAVSLPTPSHAQWRGYGPGFAFAAGAAVMGAAIAPRYYGYGSSYFYNPPYVPAGPIYARPVYAAPYSYEPVYAVPYGGYGYAQSYGNYPYPYYRPGRCFTDEGYGRYRPCTSN